MKLDHKYKCKNKSVTGDMTIGKYYKIYYISYSPIYGDNLYWFMNDYSEPKFVTFDIFWHFFENEKQIRKEKLIEIYENSLHQ
jgi:hypothetical protein